MADVITGTPQLDAVQLQLIASIVQRELSYKAKLFRTTSDVSSFAQAGSDSIKFPKTGSFTATNRGKSAVVDAQALTFGNDILLLDQDPTVKYIIDSYADLQSMVNAELESAKRAASANARYVDAAIAAALVLYAGHTENAIAANATAASLLKLQEFNLQNNAELEDLVYVASVDQRTSILSLPEFTEAQVYGGMPSPLATGVIGTIYGNEVIISNGIGAQQVFNYSKEGIVTGFQRGFRRDEEKAIDHGTGAKKVVWDAIFGVKGVQLGQGTEIDGVTALGVAASALIAKLN